MNPSRIQISQVLNEENPSTEPAVKVGITVGTVAGLAGLALYFFPNIPEGVIQAGLVLAVFLLPIINGFLTRGKVWSPASVQSLVEEAVKQALEQAKKTGTQTSVIRPSSPKNDDFGNKSL